MQTSRGPAPGCRPSHKLPVLCRSSSTATTIMSDVIRHSGKGTLHSGVHPDRIDYPSADEKTTSKNTSHRRRKREPKTSHGGPFRTSVVCMASSAGGGDEQLDHDPWDIESEFGQLLTGTEEGTVKRVLQRNRTQLVRNLVVSKKALQVLTQDNLEGFGLAKADAGVLKLVFPSPSAPGLLAEQQAWGQMVAEMKWMAGVAQELAGMVEAMENKPVFSSLSFSVLGRQTKQAQSTEELLMAVINAACQHFKTIPEMCVVDGGLPLVGFKDYIGKESRPEIVLSLTAQPWFPTMLGCLEVKPDLTKGTAHDDAVGQLRARVQQTRALVPDRKKFLGGVLDKREIQLWLFTPGRTYHTDRVPIHWQKDDKGWQMLVGILAASFHRFGYVAPFPLPAFLDSSRELVQESVPIRAHPRRPVYQAQRQGKPVIVKLGDADSIQTEVDALTAVGSHPHLPTLCAHGELPSALPQGVTHYMVITPVGMLPNLEGGKTVGAREAKQRKRQFLMWLADVVSALEHMHNQGWLHRDPTPYNVVTASSTGAILLDLHLAVPASSPQASYRSGTAAFRALSLHSNSSAQHTASTDLEAVFYTFLYIASHGHALSWRYQDDPGAMKRTKLSVVTDDEEWHTALSHCMEELRPTINTLRELFFPGGSLPAYKQHQVTVAEFKEAFKA